MDQPRYGPSSERLPEEKLLMEVRQHHDGLDPTSLVKTFMEQGYSAYSVQRAVHQALDKGLVELGHRLSLRASSFVPEEG